MGGASSAEPRTDHPRARPPYDRLGCARGELEPQFVHETLLSDREHRAAENAAGRPLASSILTPNRLRPAHLHRPDFALVGADGEPAVAIEVELTLKARTRLERIVRGYLRNRNVAIVRYYASPPIAEAVHRAAQVAGADRLLEIVPLPPTTTSTIRSLR